MTTIKNPEEDIMVKKIDYINITLFISVILLLIVDATYGINWPEDSIGLLLLHLGAILIWSVANLSDLVHSKE
jgi:hypothetical protein